MQRPIIRYDGKRPLAQIGDMLVIVAAVAFVSLPILAAFLDATVHVTVPAALMQAALTSLIIGFGSAIIAW